MRELVGVAIAGDGVGVGGGLVVGVDGFWRL